MNQTGLESARESAGLATRSSSGESVETALQLAIDLHGPALLSRPDKLRQLLAAQCPGASSDIAFLLAALEERVPHALLAVTSATDLQAVEPQLQQALSERRGLNPFAATWAVSTWASALRMDLFGATISRQSGEARNATAPRPAPPATAHASATNPFGAMGVPTDEQIPVDVKTTVVPAPFTVPFGFQPPAKPVEAPPVPVEVATPIVEPPAPVIAVPVAMPTEPEPPLAAAPVEAPAAPPPPAAVETPEDLPTWSVDVPAPVRKRFNPWIGLAGVMAAAILAVVSMRFMAPSTAPPAEPIVATTAAPVPAAPPVPAIIDVVSDANLIGDGNEHAVFVSIDPARRDLKFVEATFMAGEGEWEPRVRVFDAKPDASLDGRIAVGRIGLRTTTPATATFQYVLTAADGSRSLPFVKQFAFAPVAARPSVIVAVTAPTGTPSAVTIDFTPGESRVASVERRTLVAGGGADGPVKVTPVTALASPRDGTLRYPLEAMAPASRTTFAFTLIDGDGTRSAAKQIVVEAPAAQKTAVAEPSTPPSRTAPVACTRETCGSVVAVRELDRAKNVEVLVRMDNRTIQTILSQATWKVGSRVQRVGGRLVPMGAVAAPSAKPGTRAPARLLPETPPIVDR